MADTKVTVSLEILDKAATKSLDDFQKKSEAADKSIKKMGDTSKSTFAEIAVGVSHASGIYEIFAGNVLANVVVKGFELVQEAATELFNVLVVEGVHAAEEAEAALKALNVALAQNGNFSEEASTDLEHFAKEMQHLTGIEDDAIIKNLALLENLTQLDSQGLKRAQTAAIDLSAALGIDLANATDLIGKAANGNTRPLQKLGVEFEKGTSDAATLANALNALEGRFSGQAEKQLNTFSGAVKLLGAEFNDLQESIGNTIVKNVTVVDVIKTLGSIFEKLSQDINNNQSSFKELVGKGVLFLIDSLGYLVTAFDFIVGAVRLVINSFDALANGLGLVANSITDFFGITTDAAKEYADGFESAMAAGEDALNGQNLGIRTIAEGLATLSVTAQDSFSKQGDAANKAAGEINNTSGAYKALSEEQKKVNQETQNWALGLAKATTEGKTQLDAQIEQQSLQKEQLNLIDQDDKAAQFENEVTFLEEKSALEQTYFEDQQARLEAARSQNLITQTQYDAAASTLDNQKTAALTKNEVALTKVKQQEQKRRADDTKSSLSYISSLQQESSKELFAIGKAAALAVAYIDGQAAVMKALSAAPPPFNFVLAALVGVAAAANLARIASAQPPSFQDGGIVPGNSFSGDNVSAQVNSGEMILNRGQQARLFNMANGQTGSSDKLDQVLGMLGSILAQPITVNVSGKQLFSIIRTEQDGGRSFA